MMKRVSIFENETISTEKVQKICDDLNRDRLEMLSFRDCTFTDRSYKRVMKAVGACASLSLRHLGLGINILCDSFRVQVLAQAIQRNSSLVGLHLHGNRITTTDFQTLHPHIKSHPRISSLDLGDCNIGDESMDMICSLIKENKDMPGLHNLVLSHNPNITPDGWTTLGMTLASGSTLRSLDIDYNNIGDSVACCLATALPGAAYLETLDMECTAITDRTGQVLLHLVKSYNLKLKSINLKRTQVPESTKEAIKLQLSQGHTGKNNEPVSDDDCSLAMSEPPLNEDGDIELSTDESKHCTDPIGNITRTESFDTNGIPVVEIIPANKQNSDAIQRCGLNEPKLYEGTRSMSVVDASQGNLNAAGFEIKKAFSLNDLKDSNNDPEIGIESKNEWNDFEEYEAYIPDKESSKLMDSGSTIIKELECIEDLDHDDVNSKSASFYSVKGIDETDVSNSANPSPLFYTRPMSAPMSRNDTLNVTSGLLQAKSINTSATDLASKIRQKKEKTKEEDWVPHKSKRQDIEVQDIN